MSQRRILFLMPLSLFIAIVLVLWVGLAKNPRQLDSVLIGKPLPALRHSMTAFPSGQVSSYSFPDRPFLLNVFATWCAACQAEQALLLSLKRQGVLIIGLAYKEDPQRVTQWLHDHGNPYQWIIADLHGELAIDLGVVGTPEMFLVDGRGIVRDKWVGVLSIAKWQHQILPELNRWQ